MPSSLHGDSDGTMMGRVAVKPATISWPGMHCVAQLGRLVRAMPLVVLLGVVHAATAQDTTFSYQGFLHDNGAPATGMFDFQFALFDAPSGGAQLGAEQSTAGQAVGGGVFSVDLDFGASALAATESWLEIRVRRSGQASFVPLSPRQRVRPAPRAALARIAGPGAVDSASIADGSIGGNDIAPGAIGSTAIAAGAVGANHIQGSAVSAAKIQSGAVGADKIAANAVGFGKIANNAVGTAEIAADAVGASEITADAVGASEIAAGAVGSAEIGPSAVGSSEISDNAVGSAEIQDGSVGAANIFVNQVQRRVTGTCPAGASIRTVGTPGTVNCETDSQGIIGLTSPSSFSAPVLDGGGEQVVAMESVNSHLCMLSGVAFRDIDGSFERAICEILVSGGLWTLRAVAPENDEDAFCAAICLEKVVIP